MQKWWFKIFIWFAAIGFFGLGSMILISYFNPDPSMSDVMKFMGGMMNSMETSTMGLSMSIEHDPIIKKVINITSDITLPLILIGVISGIFMKIGRKVK